MKLTIMEFFPSTCYFLSLRSKYSLHHFVLRHPQSVFFPSCERWSFIPIQNTRWSSRFSCFIFTFSDRKREDKIVSVSLRMSKY